ncbi:MAG: D-aminopeptidase [Phyllobacterium sp.]
MAEFDLAAFERAFRALPSSFKGPGGVAGVVKDGQVIMREAWGYADLATRRPMTTGTLMPICSISKQFTCAVLLDVIGDPARLDGKVRDHLPNFQGKRPGITELCNNQSGLRDYWALTVLHGAAAEGVFGAEDAKTLFARMRTTHFDPGSHYSYSNGNFRILSDLIEDHAGRSLGELYAERIFDPAKMQTAAFTPDTGNFPESAVGYEGNDTVGYFPATNRIYWSGDAGISAALDDMLAWECFIDGTRDDADALYSRLSAPQHFADGTPSRYGFGLSHEMIGDVPISGHGGALRGFRCRRLYAPSERLSVVVMFNHQADAHAASLSLMETALGCGKPKTVPNGQLGNKGSGLLGHYIDPGTNLALRVSAAGNGAIEAQFAVSPETLTPDADGVARNASMTLIQDGDAIRMERPGENLRTTLTRISGVAENDITGRFHSAELDAWLDIASTGNATYGGFEGFLGKGAMQAMYPIGKDVWLLTCQRSMDAPAPGNWTVRIKRDATGKMDSLIVGCWLARNIEYRRIA